MNFFQALCNPENFNAIFTRLRQRCASDPFLRSRSPASQHLTLEWILQAEDLVTASLVRELRSRRYRPGVSIRSTVKADKDREIYSLAWPDKIVEALLAKLLSETIAPSLHRRLFSFRKGLSNIIALKDFAAYLAKQCPDTAPIYIVKRDVAAYGDSINQTMLFSKLAKIVGAQDPYVLQLLQAFLATQFRTTTSAEVCNLSHGIPAGFALTPVCENLYLADFDQILGNFSDGFYCRYGDDILFADRDPQTVARAATTIDQELAKLGLHTKTEKVANLCLCLKPPNHHNQSQFRPVDSFDHLGFNLDRSGKLFLSRRKIDTLKRELRQAALRAYNANRRYPCSETALVDACIASLNRYLKLSFELPYLGLLLSVVTNETKLKQLDLWIAKAALAPVFGTAHDRVFRYLSLNEVRKRGLTSIEKLRIGSLRGL